MKILAIDYGEKNLGIALTDGFLAHPYNFKGRLRIKRDKIKIKFIKEIVLREKIEKIIIGVPEGKIKEKVKKFAEILKKAIKLPIVLWDETLTSQEAIKKMIEAGKKRKERKNKEHNIAAALILQDYLESQKSRF